MGLRRSGALGLFCILTGWAAAMLWSAPATVNQQAITHREQCTPFGSGCLCLIFWAWHSGLAVLLCWACCAVRAVGLLVTGEACSARLVSHGTHQRQRR